MAACRVFLALLGTLAWPNVAGSSPPLFINSVPSTFLVPSSSQALLSVGGGPVLGGALGGCSPASAARLPCARRRRAPMSLTMVDAKKDYYAVLGVGKKADTQEIKRAFKRLAMRNHPDVSKDPNAKSKFIEINEAYAVLSDPDQRRKYDLMSANPFSGSSSSWGRSSSYSSRRSSSSGAGAPPGTGDFDFDSYWKRYRGSDESPRDIDDSFSKIFDELFTGVRKAREGVKGSRKGGSRSDSLLDDLGDFLETVLGIDDLDGGSDSYEDLDEEALNLELKDAELVVEQLQQRMERLKADAAKAEATADEWGRKADRSTVAEEKGEFMQKQKSMATSASRLRERSREVQKLVQKQTTRLDKIKTKVKGGSSKSRSSSSSSAAGEKVIVGCTSCGQKIRVPGGVAGIVSCPACGASFRTGEGSRGSSKQETQGRSSSSAAAEKVVVNCPSCSQGLRVPKGESGRIDCPKCATSFRVDDEGKVTGGGGGGGGGGVQGEARAGTSGGGRDVAGGDDWMDEYKMKEELRRARVEDDLSQLKRDMGKK